MIKFKCESAGHPDYMRINGFEADKVYSVREFVDDVLTARPNDHGDFKILESRYGYKKGLLLDPIPFDIQERRVVNVGGISSYFNASYELDIEGEGVEEKKSEGFTFCEIWRELYEDMAPIINKYEKKFGMPILSIGFDRLGDPRFSTDYLHGQMGVNITTNGNV